MVMSAALSLFVALIMGGLVLVRPIRTPRARTRLRAGMGRRARTIALPRRRGWVAALWVSLQRIMLGETRGPVGPTLVVQRPEMEGIGRLRWRLLHAGYGHRSITWLRAQQAEATVAVLILGVALGVTLTPPFFITLALIPLALAVGYRLPLFLLERQSRARQARLRIELITFLYGLAALVVRGRPVERAMDRLALRPGELAREVSFARELHMNGLPMDEALEVLAARCGGEEVREAMSLIAATLSGAVALDRAATMFTDLAGSVRAIIDERRHEELAYAVLRATALGTALGLPIVGTTLLYPVLSSALRTLTGGGP